MQISAENIEQAQGKAADESRRRLPVGIRLASVSLVLIVLLAMLIVPLALAGGAQEGQISRFGPLDILGTRLYALEPLPTSFQPGSLPYDEQALVITRDAQRNARKAAQEHVEAERLAWEAMQTTEENEVEASVAGDELQPEPDYEETARQAEQSWLEEQNRLAAEQQAAAAESARIAEEERVAEQQRVEQESLRLQAQRAQEEEARRKAIDEANYLYSLLHPSKGQYRKAIAVAGEVVPWVFNRDTCPEDIAGMWRGTGDVDDGAGSYVVGHNPGVFHMLIDSNIGIGDVVSVWDANGDAKAYIIDDVFVIDEGTVYDAALRKRTTESGGESITLQTCIDEGTRYKVFVAH